MTARLLLLLLLVLSAGCIPVLTSAPTGETATSDWVAPDNAWDQATPPADLVGEGMSVGQVAPDFRMMDQNGQEVSLWQFYGSVIIIDVSTMWCAPCQKLADEICSVQGDYESQGFAYLTVLPQNTVGEIPSQDDLVEWTTDHNICAPVLSDDVGLGDVLVPDGAFPSLTVIDQDMKVVNERIAPAEDSEIRAEIEALF